jgi:hypothetical protein
MKALVVLSCVAATLAATAYAQAPPAAEPRFTAIGCVSAQPTAPAARGSAATPQFIITDVRAETPLVYRLTGDAAALKARVGQTVEVSGPVTPGSRTSKAPNASAPLMKVEKITWLAATCRQAKKD